MPTPTKDKSITKQHDQLCPQARLHEKSTQLSVSTDRLLQCLDAVTLGGQHSLALCGGTVPASIFAEMGTELGTSHMLTM